MDGISVSIVMPVYNAESFLRQSLDDILSQTERDFELLCVDDGSTDGSIEILEEYCSKDSRIHIIKQANKGGGAARNNGLYNSSGNYVMFLDADDRFDKELVEFALNGIKETKADVLVFGGDLFDYQTGEIRPHNELLNLKAISEDSLRDKILTETDKRMHLFEFTNTTAWNKIYKKEFLNCKGIQFQEIYVVDTMYFTMVALCLADRVGFVDRIGVHYRLGNPTGQLQNHDKNPMGAIDALSSVRQTIMGHMRWEEYERTIMIYGVDMIMRRFNMLKSFEGIKKVYDRLHDELIVDWNFEKYVIDGKKTERWKRLIHTIKGFSLEEYLYDLTKKGSSRAGHNGYRLPQVVKGKKILLYGAGKVGKSYFCQNIQLNECNIIGWIDKNAERIGYPVMPLNEISNKEYDYILIAVEDKSIAEEIKLELQRRDIPIEKIMWEYPIMG